MRARLHLLIRDRKGTAITEFAMLAPLIITLFLGVFHVGSAMQAYNALRSLSMDTARFAAVEYQKNQTLTNSQITDWAKARGTGAPYLLKVDRMEVVTDTAGTQRVTGANERTLTIRYALPSFLGVIGIGDIPISYSRPIFVPL